MLESEFELANELKLALACSVLLGSASVLVSRCEALGDARMRIFCGETSSELSRAGLKDVRSKDSECFKE